MTMLEDQIHPEAVRLIRAKIMKAIAQELPRFIGTYLQPSYGAQVYPVMLALTGTEGQRLASQATDNVMVLLRLQSAAIDGREAVVGADSEAGTQDGDAKGQGRNHDAVGHSQARAKKR